MFHVALIPFHRPFANLITVFFMLRHTFDIKLFSLLKMLRVTLDKLLNIFLTPLLKALAKETTLFL